MTQDRVKHEMAYRKRQREKGLAHVRVWVPEDQKHVIKELARNLTARHLESKP